MWLLSFARIIFPNNSQKVSVHKKEQHKHIIYTLCVNFAEDCHLKNVT